MEQLPKMDQQAVLAKLIEQAREAAVKICQAVDGAPRGALISGSEEAVRDLGHELMQTMFQTAVQGRIDAAEAAFPPSGGSKDQQTQAE